MIINSVTLKNFRSYEEEACFILQPQAHQNITLIGGENGAGKSTLFEALKLCIFGPLAYGYQGFNPVYNNKVKSNINHNAFKTQNIDAFIQITITVLEGIDEVQYTLRRSWTFEDTHLVEAFEVHKFDQKLNDRELDVFQNYLVSIIPPNLFNFFFFDGEELSDFFSGKNANLHLKEAILKLCNYDTLDLLKKHLLTYQRIVNKTSEQANAIEEEYRVATEKLETLNKYRDKAEMDLKLQHRLYDDLQIEKSNLDYEFRMSGGLLDSEKTSLHSQMNALDNERANINAFIKDFCNDDLPLFICHNQLLAIKTQIQSEEELALFSNIKSRLSPAVVELALTTAQVQISQTSNALNTIPDLLLDKMFDRNSINEIEEIHNLSLDDKNLVIGTIDTITRTKEQRIHAVPDGYKRIEAITKEITEIRNKIEASINQDLLAAYIKDNLRINEKIAECKSNMEMLVKELEHLNQSIPKAEYAEKRAKNAYIELVQSSNTLSLSNSMNEVIDEILIELTKDRIKDIEREFIGVFSNLIRKDSYVDGIEITSDFKLELYANKDYNANEIYNIINNLGFDEIRKKYGDRFIDDLLSEFQVSDKQDLIKAVNSFYGLKNMTLKTKINVYSFSKGEKQMFILCLIWALVKCSGVEIPFIIDTPYARIDESHRNTLTDLYFPRISKQVIILSTNEEIDRDLYKTIKPHVSNEYLLQYDDTEKRTHVVDGYFFEV